MKMPEPTLPTHAKGRMFTEEQLKQYGRDLLEAAINSYSPDDTAMDYINKLIDMKETL
jgi:hypothetical protein